MTVLPKDGDPSNHHALLEAPCKKSAIFQATLARELSLSGKGLFTGREIVLHFQPAPAGTGIVFQRIDLPHKPIIPALLSFVQSTPRCTILGKGKDVVQTVEHLLSALYAMHIDNLIIQVDGPEIPIVDGSAEFFVSSLEKGGFFLYEDLKEVLRLQKPVSFSWEDTHLIALPSKEFRISYTLDYPHCSCIGSQYFSTEISPDIYQKDIAASRTFALYEELEAMQKKGLLLEAGLENGIVIQGDTILNPEGLRFTNEMVRHKILDLLGDLSLLGMSLVAHIIAIRSGHFSNIAFAKQIEKSQRKGDPEK